MQQGKRIQILLGVHAGPCHWKFAPNEVAPRLQLHSKHQESEVFDYDSKSHTARNYIFVAMISRLDVIGMIMKPSFP